MTSSLYAVVDIETTGGMPKRDRITEIAIVLYNGRQIIDRFESLLNPERTIPWEITRITGITDDMVKDAPKFYEIARKIVELTSDAIFVAHNVRFDYQFIREEFASLGYSFHRPQLCTVVLSRKSFPGLRSYSLGNLIEHFGIEVENRHRAMDDVLATVNILDRALQQESGVVRARQLVAAGIRQSKTPVELSMDKIRQLPDDPGVYYFYNIYGHVIYVGKSVHIRKRVLQHFSGQDGKTDKFMARVADISFTLTGSELIAMLLESAEIKALQPEINKAQRSRENPYCIYSYTDDEGYIRYDWTKSGAKLGDSVRVLNQFSSKASARSKLLYISEQLTLCPGLCGIHEPGSGCFYYQTGSCLGACQKLEPPSSYNERAAQAMESLRRTFDENIVLVTQGRSDSEAGIIVIWEGHYKGFTFVDKSSLNSPVTNLIQSVEQVPFHPEYNLILRSWLENHPVQEEFLGQIRLLRI
ncbi:MAG: GIY-YIG nuclease family protein [Saprospiraceae bacterium]|nr:GIY-YIG nuclease family protein [Saprospiraceae bacterium]